MSNQKKLAWLALTAVLGIGIVAQAAVVDQDTAMSAASGFLFNSSVAKRVLAGCSVESVEQRGSLWIAHLAPSGYIEVAGSTKCAPILSFSSYDFAEPEVGSPLVAKLSADNLMIEKKEADESLEDNADWAKYTAPVTKKRMLLAAKPTGTDSTGYDPYVAPLLGATWNQTAPFNDLSPYNYFCGCMATAAGQELRYWRWPYRYEKFRQSTHGVRDAQLNYSDFVIRPNGLVPFNWDKVVASAPNPASTPWAADKEATYNTAWLSLWAQSLTGMGYKPGGSGGTRQLAGTAEEYWYEQGRGYTYWNDGYEALWAAVKADLDWGSPIQINTAAHQMVIDGYAVENNGTDDEVDWINLNLGYGNATYWDNLKTAVTEGTYSGTLASFQTGFRPQKIVQFEPVPMVSDTSLTLAWHIAPCYTNRISGFLFQTLKDGNNVGAGMIPSLGDTTERYTYTVTDLAADSEYTFTVTPIMSDASEARSNSVTTTIGTPQPAPEIISVSSVACGIELLQQDIFIECAYGIVNKIDLTCSESTTEVVPYSSHLTILPDGKLSVTRAGNVFTVNVDATTMDPKWSGEMLVLTLVAKNGDGTEAYKNLMLRFNSMRQVINGTFAAAEGDSDSPVWFCGDTTIDAKGRAVSFGATAFQGTGKVTLVDSVGNGSFTFAGLDNFKGTLVFTGNCSVTLPEDMTGFSGTLKLTSGTYNISSDFTSDATIILDGAANDYESVVVNLNSVNLGATVTGWGTINISSGECTFAKTIASNSTLVRLTGGTLTTPADDSDYCYVQMDGGTLKVNLTEAQTQLGYKWKLPLYQSGDIKFVLSDTTEEDVAVVVEGGLATISHDTDANIWTGTDYWFNSDRYNDTTKWSKGALPTDGDYVIFNSAGNGDEGMNGYGTAMVLNLPSAVNLGYVQVRGDSGLEITTVSGISTAVLKVGVLENQVMTKIKATEFQPETVIPKRALYISEGYPLTCDLEYRYADNLKQSNSSSSALISSAYWQGTVLLSNQNVSNLEISNYGNAQSRIRFNGVTGSLIGGKTFEGILELVDYDGSPAFNLNSGSSNYGVTIGAVAGSGMFKTSGSASTLNILLKDISDWTGSFDLASKTIAIGQAIPSSYTGNDGRLHICQEATVVDGATWKAAGGLYLGAGGALTINGDVEAKNVTTYGTGASITLEDGAVLQVSAASVNDSAPTLNFKSGIYRVKEGSDAFRETATINFCAASGKHTAIDANGATLTLGPNVFSGSGDVYLTSSKAGGKIVVEGISADYTGTIYCDISCEVSFGDLSKATNCNINVSDIILSRSSSDVGNLTVGLGASLEVTVTKDNQINGCTIDTVTLNDGATMVLRDKTGEVLETFTEENAVDGKYVLAPDPSIQVGYLLDYEFNGNMNSIGTDTTGLSIWNGTASYDSESEKIYMRCKPYINKTFAMPDDEWSVFMRCTLPAANSEKPTMMLMFGKNGGNVFGLVAGTGENTVALASRDNLIGEAVQVENGTTKQHVYAIVKTANRVRLYVDGELKVDESATVSVSKEFQIGSVKNGNNTSYDPCNDANALIDYMRFYDFAVGQSIIDEETVPDDDPVYEGPAPIAVWVAGEFDDDRSAHGGLEFALNDNTIDENGNIVIGSTTTLGATVAVPTGILPRMTMLVKYSVPSGGAPAVNSIPVSLFSTYDMGARAAQAASSALDGYWYNGSSVQAGTYAFSTPAQTMPQEGYILVSNWTTTPNDGDHGTAVYSGESLSSLTGGEVTGLRFTGADKEITVVGVGGPTVAAAVPWAGMVIKSVALFDEWVTPSDLANYTFPEQGAVQPVDTDRYVVEPVASWVNDFKTTTKGNYSLSVSGTTAAKDDTFGGTLTIGDAAAVIDTTAANSANMTVLIKYRAASSVTTAPVAAFGGMSAVGLDVGVYTKSDKTLAVYRNFSTDNGKPYDFATAPTLSANGGYVLCARDNGQQCMAYVGDSLDAMTGGTVSNGGIKFSNVVLTKLGIGGNSGIAANANDMVPFTGFVVEKVVVFNGYYTPDQIRYIPNPEDGDTVNIAANTTWTFTASDTPREYTSVGTLSSSGTIAIANASELTEGTYPLATWTTPQQYTTQCAGYGKVGTLVTEGLAEGLSARLIYGARAIYLRVDDIAKQAARKPLVVWCYGDSITEGYNAQATGANYRILLYQKLEMLGYNVRSTGVYGLSNGYNSVDPSGTALTDQYRWHSAKHGATAGPSSLSHRSNLSENVDTLAIQAGTPDVALLLIGVNDLPQFSTVEPVFAAWTNVVNRLVNNLPNTKIIASTILYSDGTRTDIDPKITNINDNYIKPLMASLPEAWQGHVVLADLNSIVKSGDPGIIYSDHLHPDWWGYDQMADGYLDKIVECYPDPDATNFPSQNPIPDAPTENELGAANMPELAAYRAGFTKLCNIRVEKGQDVSNVVYDDVNSAAASDNLEKVGYFVEFVRDDNHAHKWVWVDMDAFGDKDLASVGLPQRNYQQAVTKMHVCSNHGAIDNVAADDDSVTGWIEFSPYDYTRTASNSAAPANYGDPFDWNDTLSESGSYGCMQVFRVMNPSSRDLYERPQLMFAFNNFQSQNGNPADFGIGNFAQHFNCNNSYHTEDWTGVGGTLAKMAPDQYSVKTIEIWTKEMPYEGPDPVAVWVAGEFDDDRSAHGGCEFALNGNTIDGNGNIVIGNSTTLGATIATPGYDNATVLVEYEIPSGGAPAANSVPASVFVTKEMGALAGSGSSDLGGYWLNGSTVTTGYAFSSPAPSIPQKGYLLISTPANSDSNPGNHYVAAYVGETVSALSGGETSGLRFTGAANRVTSVGIGGPTVAGAVPWAGMVIKNVAIFGDWVTPADIANYKFPEQGAVQPVDTDRYTIEPVVSWVNDFKTTEKGDYTLSVSGTTAAKDDTFGGTLTIGDAAAVVDVRNGANGGNLTVLVKYRATPATVNAPVVTFGETLSNSVKIDVGAYTQSARTLAVNRSYNGGNNKWVALNTAASLNEGEGYLLCARKTNDMLVYVGNSLDNMAGGSTAAPGDISYSCDLIQAIGIGGPSGLPNADATWSAFDGFVVEKVVVFNGYYTPDQIRYVENPEDGDTVNIADNTTWKFAATATPREYTNIGTLSSSGTIAITNASELAEGTYTLATWTTAQKKSTGYGHVALSVDGIPDGLSAELVYGAKAIYLRVWNPTTQAARGTIKVWPYGDSITEGFNAGGTRANYRVLLAQKLSMLGFNVEMVGCYDKINGADVIDPAGQVVPDAWKWHSAKHGATAGPTTSATGRANLCENVDTLSAQAGNPDVVLLLAGANDIVPQTGLTAAQVVSSITNIVAHLAANLPNTKIVVGNQINVESGYNSGNYNHVVSMIPEVNSLLKTFVENLPPELTGRVFLADLNSYVKSGEYGILFDQSGDHLHPDWWGHDQMAEGWLSVITNKFTATQVFPSATVPAAPATEELGAAAKSELAAYRKGFKLARRIDAASNLDTANPYADTGDGATENIEKVGYFVEFVRADNNAHKWVWVDMDAFGTTIGEVGLPTANHQQVVTKLHVKSNHNGIDDVAADDESVSGFIEFSPYDYNGNVSGVSGAPAGNASCCDWNDTLSTSGSYGCMQVHRVFSPAKSEADGVTRGGQVLFAYNNWQSSSSSAEFGIGNFSSHFYRGANDAQTLDYTYTANAPKMNASAYSVKRIEIWTKEKATATDFPTPYSWIDMYFPELVSGWDSAQYNDFATNKNHGSVKNGYAPWESYVLGLDPTNETSKFVTTIRMEGTTPIVEYSPTNEVLKASNAIEYVLQGKPALSNDWQDVDFNELGDTNRFFRVKIEW